MRYIKCPICEINYMEDSEEMCDVCKNQRTGTVGTSPIGDGENVKIEEPALLIRINRSYYNGISSEELYNLTRGVWRLGAKKDNALYAFSVYQGVVLEVYRIFYWERGTRYMKFADWSDEEIRRRWAFVGEVDKKLSEKYKNKLVKGYFQPGNANPTLYVNC